MTVKLVLLNTFFYAQGLPGERGSNGIPGQRGSTGEQGGPGDAGARGPGGTRVSLSSVQYFLWYSVFLYSPEEF